MTSPINVAYNTWQDKNIESKLYQPPFSNEFFKRIFGTMRRVWLDFGQEFVREFLEEQFVRFSIDRNCGANQTGITYEWKKSVVQKRLIQIENDKLVTILLLFRKLGVTI
jgi:hypothetical protein